MTVGEREMLKYTIAILAILVQGLWGWFLLGCRVCGAGFCWDVWCLGFLAFLCFFTFFASFCILLVYLGAPTLL